MTSKVTFIAAFVVVLMGFMVSDCEVAARYLPTRANGDRLDKLRELLKDLLESEMDKEEAEPQRWRPDSKYFVKRDIKMQLEPRDTTVRKVKTRND